MKKSTILFAFLTLSLTAFAQDSGLWLLTARISQSRTMNKDTLIRTEAGNHIWEKERHVAVRTMTRGEITAVIENQAEDPANEFVYHSDSGEPISITVSGEGSHSESSKFVESIDGTMTNADNREINVSGSALPEASLMFYYSPDSKDASASMGIKGKGSDKGRMYFDEWKDYGGDLDDYYLSCSAGCGVSGDRNCKITKTPTGFQATWKFSESKQLHTVNGTEFITTESSLSLTINPYKEPDKPEVKLYGCSELGMEEQGEVIASGKPEGGKFRFWVEPGNLLTVESDGESSAIIKGSTPGKGTLYVEYTTPEGKTNTASQPASIVKIEKYNAGQKIPQIALFDVDGKKLPGVLKIPVTAQPSNLEELVDFVAADKTVLSAVGLSGAVELTGSKEGNTTLQAKTNCGHTTGPTVEVEIVNCDDETIARLEKQRKAATENLLISTKELQMIAGSSEFEKARDDLVGSTIDLLAKTGLTVISGGKPTSKVVKTAAEMADVAAGLSDMLASGSHEEVYVNGVKAAAGKIWGEAASTLVGLGEVAAAADRFYKNIAEIQLHEEALKSALESYEKALKALEDVVRRQQICKRDEAQPQKKEDPKADPKSKPTDPKPPVDPKPKTDTPPAQKPPTEPPAPKPGDKESPISPPPPTGEPRQVGLPYSPEDCGCDKPKEIGVTSEGFSTLQAGTKNIGDCVEKFNSVSVTEYINTLNELSAITGTLKAAGNEDPALFEVKAKEVKPQLDDLIKRTKAYDVAGQTFMKQFEKCPESVKTGMDVLKSALTVTVDSITTKY